MRGWTILRNPIARKRWARFRKHRRAWISLRILTVLYALSLGSELLCNDRPLYVRFRGRSYVPFLRFYPEDVFLGNGNPARPNYRRIQRSAAFREDPTAVMIFAPIPFGPTESVDPDTLPAARRAVVTLSPSPRVGYVNIRPDFRVASSVGCGAFFRRPDDEMAGLILTDHWQLPEDVRQAVAARFRNEASPSLTRTVSGVERPDLRVEVSLSAFEPRRQPPSTVRLTLRDPAAFQPRQTLRIDRAGRVARKGRAFWDGLPPEERARVMAAVEDALAGQPTRWSFSREGVVWEVAVERERISWPHPPVRGHWLGLDSAGRDVLARLLYGMRISMTFGLLLVAVATFVGIAVGALQGYYGGAVDLTGQRLIEVWSALPFLYVMMLLGSVYGRSFLLLLGCYALFNWIGISYYVRAEFLRLRNLPFVDAARCLGVSGPVIILRHMVPNALTPVITFFPFSLVGAIGALAALDYLGFGVPDPTPSWGQLLYQAQQYRWAWWLILYPSLALFIVMLLGVLIGEGVRDAYDPRTYTRLE